MKVTKNREIKVPKALLKKDGIVVLKLSDFEKLKEDLEMLQSKKLAQEIAEGRRQVKKGEVVPIEKVAKMLK